jgi:hypothetical protein
MIAIFKEAFGLLFNNLRLFGAIILTVMLPGNLLTEYVAFNASGPEEFPYDAVVSLIVFPFIPLYIGAMVHALSRIKQGYGVTYNEAYGVGFENWSRLFWTRLLAGVYVFLGLLALVVPGIILLIRYALLDAVVILEGAGGSEAIKRSTELTRGIRPQIFCAFVYFVGIVLLMAVAAMPLTYAGLLDSMVGMVILECAVSVIFSVITIVLFLFYWEASGKGRERSEVESEPTPPTPSD